MTRVVVRTMGSEHIGLGHLRRTLTLAQALKDQGAHVTFLLEGGKVVTDVIRRERFDLVELDEGHRNVLAAIRRLRPAIVVVDVKHHSPSELQELQAIGPRVAVVDVLASVPLSADLITNSALYAKDLPYPPAPETILLLGPRYALLRYEFAAEPKRHVRDTIHTILITLGAGDGFNLTPRLVRWVRAECPEATIIVVAGPFFRNLAEIRAAGADEVLMNPVDIRSAMLASDLAISGGGQTTYELIATATPVLGIQLDDDQARNLAALGEYGVVVCLGEATAPGLEKSCREHLARLARAQQERARMGHLGRQLVDGLGARRVANEVLALSKRRRLAAP